MNIWGTKNNLIKSKLQKTFSSLLCRKILSHFFSSPASFPYFTVCFGRTLVEHVGIENLKTWAEVNRGAIILCW